MSTGATLKETRVSRPYLRRLRYGPSAFWACLPLGHLSESGSKNLYQVLLSRNSGWVFRDDARLPLGGIKRDGRSAARSKYVERDSILRHYKNKRAENSICYWNCCIFRTQIIFSAGLSDTRFSSSFFIILRCDSVWNSSITGKDWIFIFI